MNPLADIQRQVMWNRLLAVVEEQAQTMIRTAFSTTVREAGDRAARCRAPDGDRAARDHDLALLGPRQKP